jgi:hypothetical protein
MKEQRRMILMEQLRSIKRELGLEKDDKATLIGVNDTVGMCSKHHSRVGGGHCSYQEGRRRWMSSPWDS